MYRGSFASSPSLRRRFLTKARTSCGPLWEFPESASPQTLLSSCPWVKTRPALVDSSASYLNSVAVSRTGSPPTVTERAP